MKKIPVWKNVVLILSILVVIIIATLAWFITGNYGSVFDMSLDVGNASYILISDDSGENWSEDLEVDLKINRKFKEISGDGINFFKPVYEFVEKPDGAYVQDLVKFEKVNNKKYYFDQIYAFKTDADYEVYLSPESIISYAEGKENGYIQGAIRVAFYELDEDENETLKCIWAPNSKIEFSQDSNTFNSNGNVESNYYFQKTDVPVDISSLEEDSDNTDIAVVSTKNSATGEILECGYDETNKFMWSDGKNLPENAPQLLNIKLDEDAHVQYKKMKVRVWIEGHDRECVSLLNGKEFTMKFKFNANKGE